MKLASPTIFVNSPASWDDMAETPRTEVRSNCNRGPKLLPLVFVTGNNLLSKTIRIQTEGFGAGLATCVPFAQPATLSSAKLLFSGGSISFDVNRARPAASPSPFNFQIL